LRAVSERLIEQLGPLETVAKTFFERRGFA
jgi:hypothetical protein